MTGVEPGLTGQVTLTVCDADTALALGSGDLRVLGTPRVVALAERAALATIASRLASEQTSVGSHVSIDHLAPSTVGATVTATARLAAAQGRRLEFTVEVTSDGVTVAVGRHTRVVVDRSRFPPPS